MAFQTLNLSGPEVRTSAPGGQPLPTPQPYTPGNFSLLFGGHESDAGEVVTEQTTLAISTCYACIRVLSESVGSLPLRLYRKTAQGRIQATDQPLHRLLSIAPNEEMGACSFFEVLVTSMALAGNAYAEIERNTAGDVVALWPLHPNATSPIRVAGKLAYRTSDGETVGAYRVIAAKDMLHIPLFPSYDGIVGLSPLQMQRQTIGHARAAERFGARFLKNYATPAIALISHKLIKPEDKLKMRRDWELLQTGANQHQVAILDQGLKAERLGFNAEEAQYLETRKFLREELAAIYRVPAHMVGDNTKLANSSVEGQNLSFVVDSLRPYLTKIENEIIRKLLPFQPGKTAEFEVEFDVSERLRGDVAASTNYFKTAIQFGWMCPNDVRRELNLNEGPPALNVFQTPVNMMNADRLLDPIKVNSLPLPTSTESVMND